MAMRPAGISGVPYNVPTWKAYEAGGSDLKQTRTDASVAGDGFDTRVLNSDQKNRTPNIFNSGQLIDMIPIGSLVSKDTIHLKYASQQLFKLTAYVVLSKAGYPTVNYTLKPQKLGYFSVAYTGSPAFEVNDVQEIWQPLIWQEKRFPDNVYMTPAHMAPLPTTFISDGTNTVGVMAAPQFLPFDPLPVLDNSQFGISVRDNKGLAQSQVFAPILGGYKSKMNENAIFNFQVHLVVEPQPLTYAYEQVARDYFGFKDYRKNDISSLNQTLENIVNYSLDKNTWFIDSLKGYSYSTDVPGAVKNVSSLNPLELSIVMDNKQMFEKRAYPLMEYMLSREKFLFALDSTQEIQHPSRKMRGPVAPISELVSLYRVFGKSNHLFLKLAGQEYNISRERNLDVKEDGNTWVNAMHLYKANGNKEYLQSAISLADDYLESRVHNKQTQFNDKLAGSYFFWPAFTNKWIDLLQLFELTGEKRYLQAAHEGARYYTMFTWVAPKIPDSLVTVNVGGKAPMYWYLKSKGHKQMYYPEEKVPAWRLSEIGLTPESSGTSSGHRAIFMANYAPFLLKLGYYAKDDFLKQIAKAAIVGRYRNFPGYHINTARTTAYEKLDFPLHAHLNQSVNSFHYNHILPMASMLLDYLVTDAFVRSNGKINFPSEFIEGYAYLQSHFYGSESGSFYNEKGLQLWMPEKLLQASNVELNYISAIRDNNLFIAFMNQTAEVVKSSIQLNNVLVKGAGVERFILKDEVWGDKTVVTNNNFDVTVAPNGITIVKVSNVKPQVLFQNRLLAKASTVQNDFVSVDFGPAKAMLFTMGKYTSRAYVYLEGDDNIFSQVTLSYMKNGKPKNILDASYPYEFTVEIGKEETGLSFQLNGIKKDGSKVKSKMIELGDPKLKKTGNSVVSKT